MPTYLMLTTLTPQGVQTLKANPSRLREVNRDVEELGAKVLHQWATLGEYDFVNIVEARRRRDGREDLARARGPRQREAAVARARRHRHAPGRSRQLALALLPLAEAVDGLRLLRRLRLRRRRLRIVLLEPARGFVLGIDADCALALAPLQGAAARDRPLVAHRNPGSADGGREWALRQAGPGAAVVVLLRRDVVRHVRRGTARRGAGSGRGPGRARTDRPRRARSRAPRTRRRSRRASGRSRSATASS